MMLEKSNSSQLTRHETIKSIVVYRRHGQLSSREVNEHIVFSVSCYDSL